MKCCILFAALAATLSAQVAGNGGAPPPDTVIATVDGQKFTVGELQNLLNFAPQFAQAFHRDPSGTIAQTYVLKYLAGEAEKMKLQDQTPFREQFEIQRENFMANAMTYYMRNHYDVPVQAVSDYYQAHKSEFEQVRVKDIKISYKPGLAKAGTSDKDLEDAAKAAFNAAHSATDRPEADAKKIADDVVKQLRAGGDFGKLVAKYSEDQETKDQGGDFGTIKGTSAYPADLVKAALALKPGEVSDPVKVGNVAFYIIKAEERTFQPMAEVNEPIIQRLRQEHFSQQLNDLMQRFKPTIDNPQLLMQFTSTPSVSSTPKK